MNIHIWFMMSRYTEHTFCLQHEHGILFVWEMLARTMFRPLEARRSCIGALSCTACSSGPQHFKAKWANLFLCWNILELSIVSCRNHVRDLSPLVSVACLCLAPWVWCWCGSSMEALSGSSLEILWKLVESLDDCQAPALASQGHAFPALEEFSYFLSAPNILCKSYNYIYKYRIGLQLKNLT